MENPTPEGTRSAVRRLALAAKESSREALRVASELAEWLRRRGVEVFADDRLKRCTPIPGLSSVDQEEQPVDLYVVLGGDGTLLSVARSAPPGIPILGVNLGRLGFLTEIRRSEMYPALMGILRGDFEMEERRLLRVIVHRASGGALEYRALNDVVVNKSALARMIQLNLDIEGQRTAGYRSDGLILSTPTGSTAYNLSAGGPILYPTLPVVVLTPICPHTLSMRPLVVPDQSKIELTLDTDQAEVFLTVDGQEGTTLGFRDRVLVTADPSPICLVKVHGRTYYDSLRNKLGWGE